MECRRGVARPKVQRMLFVSCIVIIPSGACAVTTSMPCIECFAPPVREHKK